MGLGISRSWRLGPSEAGGGTGSNWMLRSARAGVWDQQEVGTSMTFFVMAIKNSFVLGFSALLSSINLEVGSACASWHVGTYVLKSGQCWTICDPKHMG